MVKLDSCREDVLDAIRDTMTGYEREKAAELLTGLKHTPDSWEQCKGQIHLRFGTDPDQVLRVTINSWSLDFSLEESDRSKLRFTTCIHSGIVDELVEQFQTGFLAETCEAGMLREDRRPNAHGQTYAVGDTVYAWNARAYQIVAMNQEVVVLNDGPPGMTISKYNPHPIPITDYDRNHFEWNLMRDPRNRCYTNLLAYSLKDQYPQVLHAVAHGLLNEDSRLWFTNMVQKGKTNADIQEHLHLHFSSYRYRDNKVSLASCRQGVEIQSQSTSSSRTVLHFQWSDVAAIIRGLVLANWMVDTSPLVRFPDLLEPTAGGGGRKRNRKRVNPN